MIIAIGSDHGGFELKDHLIKFLRGRNYEVNDLGTHSRDSCDYPLMGFEVGKAVSDGKAARGILICKSGIGMAIIANKVPGVRAAACYNKELARSAREHNDTNVLVFGASFVDPKLAEEMADIWLTTEALKERHLRRVDQIKELEVKAKEKGRKR